jgi:hypothetical protein
MGSGASNGPYVVDTESAAVELAAELVRSGRPRPVVVVTTAGGAAEPFVDVEDVVDAVEGLCDVYVMPTGAASWAFSSSLPEGRQVYGGASRVYPVDRAWLENPGSAPIRFAYGRTDRERATRAIISDAMAAVHAAGGLTEQPRSTRGPANGSVVGVVGGRCLVTLSDGSMATVWPELVAPDVPAERLFTKGMSVDGLLDATTRVLDVAEMRSRVEVRDEVAVRDVLLGRVVRIARESASVEILPGAPVVVSAYNVTGDASADLRGLLSDEEVLAVEITEITDKRLRGRVVGDVVLDEVSALSVLPDGPPWLVPPEPLALEEEQPSADVALVQEDVPTTGDIRTDALLAENEQLRSRLAELDRRLDRRTRERDDARTAARKARERTDAAEKRAAAEHGDRLPLGRLFRDPADLFRYRTRHAWVTRTTADDKEQYPWREVHLGDGFLASLSAVEGIDDDRVAEVAADLVCGRADQMSGYEMHQLRSGAGAEDRPVVRERGETCWRVALQRNTPSARRLHFWRRADGSVELSSVRLHDDMRP